MSASLATDRGRIVDALAVSVTIGGEAQELAPTRTVPAAIHAWSAWPVADGSTWVNACAADSRWRVFVALPAGDAAAAAAGFDAIHDVIAPNLARLGRVEDVLPAAWPVANADAVPVVQINLTI